MGSSSSSSSRGGVGFLGLLTILFIALKLTNVVDWSWWGVLAPIWVPAAIGIVVLLIMGFWFFILAMRK